MEIDTFINTIDVRTTSLKETVGRYAQLNEKEGLTLIDIIHVQTAYIDKLRLEIL